MRRSRWTEIGDGRAFLAVGETQDHLAPGIYEPAVIQGIGLVLAVVDEQADHLLDFPDTASHEVLVEIERFWDSESVFSAHDLPYKRGVLLHGPPGSGKTTTMRMIARGVVSRGGLVLLWNANFLDAYRALREVEPETPVVTLMEDLDTYITSSNESKVLNILDGIEPMHNVVFLASTNHIEKLEDRLTNRPSRFDRRVLIDPPNEASRVMYLNALKRSEDDVDVEQMARDTKGLSFAHVKEMFVAVAVLGVPYPQALKRLQRMAHHDDGTATSRPDYL